MDEFKMEEFEKRIRFEEGISKDVDHLRLNFSNHLEDEKRYTEKFEKVQESHNNLLNRINNAEDDIADTNEYKKEIVTLRDKQASFDKTILLQKVAIFLVGLIALISLTAHPTILKFLKPVVEFIF